MADISISPEIPPFDPVPLISKELNLASPNVSAVIALLEQGNTVPFIARYRKEVTGAFDEVQIRDIQDKLAYFTELDQRKRTIIKSIFEQGKLTEQLKEQITNCQVKTVLEDLYLPYKPKRRTRAMIAREKGLEPLALLILSQPLIGDPVEEAEKYVSLEKEVLNGKAALSGARDIIAEILSEKLDIRSAIREIFASEGVLTSRVAPEKEKEKTKFEQYYEFSEAVKDIPSHRYLAIRRGEEENVLQTSITIDIESAHAYIKKSMQLNPSSPFANELNTAIEDAYKRLIAPSIETDIRVELKLRADEAAVDVFAQNLRNLLLAAPLGERNVIGIDPGLRTGCKCAAVDATGKYLDTITIYPSQGKAAEEKAAQDLLRFIQRFNPFAIAIGNGTAGRETESFVKKLLADAQLKDIITISVNEAGASVYSASEIAREEFPELDLTIRGAISIARRLQDPLAELVKIDPKSIGVGQYQHDVYQPILQEKLHNVVESCVNHVGVEINTASASLLSYVAGIGPSLSKRIVQHREKNGAFKNRQELRAVRGLGDKIFEQAAGFLRIRNSSHPLDSSAVHPERYSLVETIANDLGVPLREMIGSLTAINQIDIRRYINQDVGELTLKDIVDELKKPGRDPRAVFERPQFRDDIHTMQDLKQGMILEGIITNVTAFGAFVDIGVHQDGLIHISALSDQFVKDPNTIVKVGDKIKVKVVECDPERKRIALTARLNETPTSQPKSSPKENFKKPSQNTSKNQVKAFSSNPFSKL